MLKINHLAAQLFSIERLRKMVFSKLSTTGC